MILSYRRMKKKREIILNDDNFGFPPTATTLYIAPKRTQISEATADLELDIDGEGPNLGCRFVPLSPEFGTSYTAQGEARWVDVLRNRSR